MLRRQESLVERLTQAGWQVYDMDFGRISATGDFEDLAAARRAAERDLPSGVPVLHSGFGFFVGHDGVGPAPGGLLPAYVLWPDGAERLVEAREELADALRGRLDWLCERAAAAGREDVPVGREAALRAIDAFAAGGELTHQAQGPVHDGSCMAHVMPVAGLRWDGFRHGWERGEDRPAEERRHPGGHRFDGAFTEVWREGFRAGAAAARERLTEHERAALAPEPTEEQLRERVIGDPAVRARSREVNAEVTAGLREFKRRQDEGDDAGARSALAALHQRLETVVREAERDGRPDAAKLARSARRLAASTQRLADEVAASGR
jgi:hypothetical protein